MLDDVKATNARHITSDDVWRFATDVFHVDSASSLHRYIVTHHARFAVLISDLAALHSGSSRILDVAGSRFTKQLIEYFCPGASVDVCDDKDVETEEWFTKYAGMYDIIILTEVIEHLGVDPAYTLFQCNKSLKLGGAIVITTVNIARHVAVYDLINGSTPYVMGSVFGKDTDRHDREYAPWELAHLTAAHGFDVKLSTFDCYARTKRQEKAIEFVQKEILRDIRLHRDTIKVVGRKIEEAKGPVRLWPVYHFSVSPNRVETIWPNVESRVALLD